MNALAFPDLAFQHPHAAWLMLGLPLLWWKIGAGPRLRQGSAAAHRAVRALVLGCLIAALMQPALIHRHEETRRVLIIDRATWAAARQTEAGRAMTDRLVAGVMAGNADVTLIEIGTGSSATAENPRLSAVMADHRADHVVLSGGALSAALEEALARIPVGSRGAVMVAGSGHAADMDWGRAVAGLLDRHIPVNVLALDAPARPAFVVDLTIAPVRVGELARAKVTISGSSGDPVRLALYSGARRLALSEPFVAQPDMALDLVFPAETAGFLPVRAVLIDAVRQTDPGPRVGLGGWAAVQDPLHLLYLGERQHGAASRLQTLLGNGFSVTARDPAVLTRPDDLAGYQAVMLDDLPAARLPTPTQHRLLDVVAAEGTGLFYTGGAAAFGAGGYDQTPLAAALPITLKQEDKAERPSVALVVVIDTSGSMIGEPIELAKQVARFAVGKLTPADSVGVVEFYGAKQWAVPLQPATDVSGVERAIGRMQAQGSSILYPAIQEAYYALKGSNARYRHILVITDAGVEEQRYQQLLSHVAQDRITLSTALVGADPEGEDRMQQWARWGHGRYYAVADPFSLVEIDLHQPRTTPSPPYRRGRFPLSAPDGAMEWQGMHLATGRPLSGYVPVGRRQAAETLLEAPGGDPVLASWQYGNGRITALMSEPLGEGTDGWQSWSGYGAWLAQLLARTADQQFPAQISLHRSSDGFVHIMLRQPDGGDARPVLRLIERVGAPPSAPLHLDERAPGLFTASTRLDPARPALVEARLGATTLRIADRARAPQEASARLPLAALARATGGTAATMPGAGEAGPAPRWVAEREIAVIDLSRWLALLALALYLTEIAWRRWPPRRRGIRE